MRILYVQASFVPPPVTQETDRFYLLSEKLEGDVLQPAWFRTKEEIEAIYGPGSYPVYTSGKFRYHWFLAFRYTGARQRLATFWFYLTTGLRLARERRFSCIVAYSHMTTGIFAGLLKLATGARLVVEIVTSPSLVYLTERPKITWRDRLRHWYSDVCLHLSMALADRVHLLFPGQLSSYRLLRDAKNSIFHDFVPVSAIQKRVPAASPYLLLVGAPWYLKGVDLLIEAFRGVASEFPDIKLKILGYYPDAGPIHEMLRDLPQVEILKAKPHAETLKVISGALALVLPSRCEGLPRVLIEGMAAGLPLVGSDVAGIPYLIHDGVNGYVVPSGDIEALQERLRMLLRNPELRARMGEMSYSRSQKEFSEKVYVQRFAQMVNETVGQTG